MMQLKQRKRVSVLMGDKVEPRRKWIENNVKFTMEEETAILSYFL